MTIVCIPMDGPQVTAQQWRQSQAATHGGGSGRRLGGRSGFRADTPSNALTVTSTTWTLGPCAAMIDPGASTHQGMYGWASDSNVSGAVNAADATYDRKDTIYIQVDDSSAGDGSGELRSRVMYLPGVPAASPVAPAIPVRSFLVGTITVPKVGGGSPTAVLNTARYVSAGAPLPVFSLTDRDGLSLYAGLTVRRMDLAGQPLQHNTTGTAGGWVEHQPPKVLANTSHVGPSPSLADMKSGAIVPIIQHGTEVEIPDVNGFVTITYPEPFPTSVTPIAWSADGSFNVSAVPSASAAQTTSSLFVAVKTLSGAIYNAGPVRISWAAFGR